MALKRRDCSFELLEMYWFCRDNGLRAVDALRRARTIQVMRLDRNPGQPLGGAAYVVPSEARTRVGWAGPRATSGHGPVKSLTATEYFAARAGEIGRELARCEA